MDSSEFTHLLERLGPDDIASVAAGLRSELASAEGEVAWWRATVEVSGALRRVRRTREASLAAHRAASAVVVAARAAGIGEDQRDDVTQVARAAAEVARALVAGEAAAKSGGPLLNAWQPVVAA